MNDLEQQRLKQTVDRMATAKKLMTAAAEAVLRDDPRAVSMATVALAALKAAMDQSGG